MARIHGRNASIYVENGSGASVSISGDLNQASLEYTSDAPDVTGFGNNTRQRLTQGLIEWSLQVSGLFDDSGSTTAACILFPLVTGSTFIQYGPAGSTSGKIKYAGSAILTSFSQELGVEDPATFSCEFVSRSGSLSASTW